VIILFALIGMAVGSVLNILIDRLPRNQPLLSLSCSGCGHRLAARDMVAVLSFPFLRGRCGCCGVASGYRRLVVEVVSGLLFALIWWHYGWSTTLGLLWFYGALFLAIAVIDLEHHLVLNKAVYPAAVIALVLSFFWTPLGLPAIFWPGATILSALLGSGLGLAVLSLPNLFSREGMGWGDVKLAGLIGLAVGFPLVGVALFIAIIIGGLVALSILMLRRKRHQFIPFAPFLVTGAFVALIWGQTLLEWHRQLLG
jgi:leader peptidase (prepilin peptidase)/N-methyltransferase